MSNQVIKKLFLSILLCCVMIVMIGCNFNFGGLAGNTDTPSDQQNNNQNNNSNTDPQTEETDYRKKLLEFYYNQMSFAPYSFATWFASFESDSIKFIKKDGNFIFTDSKTSTEYLMVSYNAIINNPLGIEVMDMSNILFIKNDKGVWIALFQYESKDVEVTPTLYHITISDDYSRSIAIDIEQEMYLDTLLKSNGFSLTPQRNGYVFSCWLVNNVAVKTENISNYLVNTNSTIVASWDSLKYDTTYKFDNNYHWHNCITPGYENIVSDKALHVFGDWVITKESTETVQGEKKKTCSVCGYTMIEVIPVKESLTSNCNVPPRSLVSLPTV